MLLRDNVYGTLEEDAARRDLTVNALYYDSGKFEVFDHVHGLQDLKSRSICIIGDPASATPKIPVRMLRVLRFAAKLDFEHRSAHSGGHTALRASAGRNSGGTPV